MTINEIAMKEAQETMKKEAPNKWEKEKLSLKAVHDFTGADIQTAKAYRVKGNFTYKQLRDEGIKGNLFVFAWRNVAEEWARRPKAWIVLDGSPVLMVCQFPCNAWRKADTEDYRKCKYIEAIVIASESIKYKDFADVTGRKTKAEPQAPSLEERLRAFKRKRSEEAFKNYQGFEADRANAEKLLNHLYNLIAEHVAGKEGEALVNACIDVRNLDWYLSSFKNDVKALERAINGESASVYFVSKVETMRAYECVLSGLDKDYLRTYRAIQEWN